MIIAGIACFVAAAVGVVLWRGSRKVDCPDCEGTGTPNPLTPDNRCPSCGGTGRL